MQIVLLGFFFFLFFFVFSHKPVTALCSGWSPSTCSCPRLPRCTDYGDGSSMAQWCACELMCTGANANPACGGSAPASCGSIGGNACSWAAPNAQPPAVCTSLGNTYDCSPCLICSGGGGSGGGDNTTKICGQVCLEHGSTDGSTGCYCSGSSSCPSPLVSYGRSSDCRTCCSWPALPACSAPPPPPPPPPPPTCTVSLSPLSLNLQIGDSQLLTANVDVQNGSISRVDFSSGNSTIASPNPSSVSSAPYTSAVYGNNVGSTTINAQAILSPSGSCSTLIPVSIETKAWFQTQGGNVYVGTELSDDIPSTATDPNFSLELDDWPGIISHQDENEVNLGEGFPSNDTLNHWLVQSKYEGKPYGSFQFFKKKFAMDLVEETYVSGRGDLPNQDGVYYAQSSRTLSGSSWNVGADRWVVLLVEGDVNINTDIIVPKGSFLAIAATGNITFGEDITQAQGMFVADGTIATAESNQVFEGQGVFASSGFSLARDFEDERNDTTPIETFVARPDFIMSSYKDATYNVWWFFQKWQEIAP